VNDERTLTRRQIVKSGGALAGAAGLAGLTGKGALAAVVAKPKTVKPRRGGTVRIGVQGPPQGQLHPYKAPAFADQLRTRMVYEPLARRTNGSDSIRLVLAQSIKANGDGSVWTVQLRPNVKFHDGSALDAQDVVYTFETAILANNSITASVRSGLFLNPGGVTAAGARTVRFTLTQPVADFDQRLSLRNDLVIVKAGDTSLDNESNGTGPFRLSNFTSGISAQLAANRNYWGKSALRLPYLAGAQILVLAAPEARINAVRGSQADIAIDLPYAAAKVNRHSTRVALAQSGITAGGINFFSINARVKPLDDNRVRLALKLACNRKELVDQSLLGFGVLGNDMICAGFDDCDKTLLPRAYDPARARTLLQQAGATNLELTITEIGGFSAPGSSALYAQQLSRVGVKATVRTLTLAQYSANVASIVQDAQMFALQGGNAPFTQNGSIFLLSTSTLNFWGWLRPQWDARFKTAQAIFDRKKRNAAYASLQKEFYNEGGMLTWGFNPVINGMSPKLHRVLQAGYGYPRSPDFTASWLSTK